MARLVDKVPWCPGECVLDVQDARYVRGRWPIDKRNYLVQQGHTEPEHAYVQIVHPRDLRIYK